MIARIIIIKSRRRPEDEAKIRIELPTPSGSKTRVFIDDQEITNLCRKVVVTSEVGEVNLVQLELIPDKVEIDGRAELMGKLTYGPKFTEVEDFNKGLQEGENETL